MEFVEFTAKTVDDAITAACQKFLVTSDKLEYEVILKIRLKTSWKMFLPQ